MLCQTPTDFALFSHRGSENSESASVAILFFIL